METNCIQITINGEKLQFRGVGNLSSDLSKLVKTLINENYEDKHSNLGRLLKLININNPKVVNTIPEENSSSYIADNIVGNLTPKNLGKVIARSNMDKSNLILPFIGMMNYHKTNMGNNNIIFTEDAELNGIFLGSVNDKIIINKDSKDLVKHVYDYLTFFYLDNQIKKNLPMKNVVEDFYKKVNDKFDTFSEDVQDIITNLNNSSNTVKLRKLLVEINSNSLFREELKEFIDELNIIINEDISGKIAEYLKIEKEYRQYIKTGKSQDQALIDKLTNIPLEERTTTQQSEFIEANERLNKYNDDFYNKNFSSYMDTYYRFDKRLDFFESKFNKTTSDVISINGKQFKLDDLIKFRQGFRKAYSIESTKYYSFEEIVDKFNEHTTDETALYESEYFPQLNGLREFIYDNAEIAAFLYKINDLSAVKRTLNVSSIIQDAINEHTYYKLDTESKSSQDHLNSFNIADLNLFADDNSYINSEQLKIRRSYKPSNMFTRYNSVGLKIKMINKGSTNIKANTLYFNINSKNNLPKQVLNYLRKNGKNNILLETSSLPDGDIPKAVSKFNWLISKLNSTEGLYTISTFSTYGSNKLDVALSKEALSMGLFVNAYPDLNKFDYYVNEMKGFSFVENITNTQYNFNSNLFTEGTVNEVLLGEEDLDQFKLLLEGKVKGLLVSKADKSLFYNMKGNVIALNNGTDTKQFVVKNNNPINVEFFNQKLDLNEKFIKQIREVEIGDVIKINDSKFDKDKYYVVNIFANDIILSDSFGKVDAVKKNTDIEVELLERRAILPFNNDNFIVGVNPDVLINSAGSVVTRQNFGKLFPKVQDSFYENASKITGIKKELLLEIMTKSTEYKILELESKSTNFTYAQTFEGLDEDTLQQVIVEIGKVISRNTDVVVHSLTIAELTKMFGEGSTQATSKAFILNGEIYVNIELASMDSPIHELSHLIMGDLKASDYDTYLELLSRIDSDRSDFEDIRKMYPNLTENDLKEEILAHVFSDYYSRIVRGYGNLKDMFDNLDLKNIISNIFNLMGNMDDIHSNHELMKKTISEIIVSYDSKYVKGFDNLSSRGSESSIERKITNLKQTLIINNLLREEC